MKEDNFSSIGNTIPNGTVGTENPGHEGICIIPFDPADISSSKHNEKAPGSHDVAIGKSKVYCFVVSKHPT